MDSDSDNEQSSSPSNSLKCIAPSILAELAHLDLSGCIKVKNRNVVKCGGYGDVLKGRCTLVDGAKLSVAIKRLRFYVKEDIILLFEKEVYVWSKLRHRNILPLLGYCFDPLTGYPLLVSKWMHEGSAWTFVNAHPNCDRVQLFVGIARGLTYLHDQGIVHSDIKSDNILVSDSGDAIICDFGCSRMIAASRSLANVSSGIKGTPRYFAYELLRPSDGVTRGHTVKTDVWAFGITVFELYFCRRPYASLSDVQVISTILGRELPIFPSGETASMEQPCYNMIKRLCEACWERNPADRPDMRNLLDKLEGEQVMLDTRQSTEQINDSRPSASQTVVVSVNDTLRFSSPSYSPSIHGEPLTPRPTNGSPRDENSICLSNGPILRLNHVLDVVHRHSFDHESTVICIRFSKDGKYLATGHSHRVHIFDTELGLGVGSVAPFVKAQLLTNTALFSFQRDLNPPEKYGDVRDVCFSNDNRLLVSGYEDRMIRVWEIEEQRIQKTFLNHPQDIYALHLSESGRFIVTSSGDRTVCILDVQNGIQKLLRDDETLCPDASFTSVAISPDERFIAAGSLDSCVRVWEAKSGNLAARLTGHRLSVYSVTFTQDSRHIISASLNKTLKLWDIGSIADEVISYVLDCPKTVHSSMDTLIYSMPDDYFEDYFATPTEVHVAPNRTRNYAIQFWNHDTGQMKFLLERKSGSIVSVFLSPTSKVLASGIGAKHVKLWSYSTV